MNVDFRRDRECVVTNLGREVLGKTECQATRANDGKRKRSEGKWLNKGGHIYL